MKFQGYLSLVVSKECQKNSELMEKLSNTFNILSVKKVQVELLSGEIVLLDVDDFDMLVEDEE